MLSSNEAEANAELENARRLLKDGNWDAANAHLQDLIRKPNGNPRRPPCGGEDLADARSPERAPAGSAEGAQGGHRSGDMSKANTIAREIGLKYLPLSNRSVPSAAEVWQGGKKIRRHADGPRHPGGRSGWITCIEFGLPGPAQERHRSIRRRRLALLARARARARGPGRPPYESVSSIPIAIGARIWVCNRQQAFAINPAGKVEAFSFRPPPEPRR